jgi:AraC-like DNA-binding protein
VAKGRRPTKAKQRQPGRALHQAFLAWCRKRYESGHPAAVLDAVDICLRSGQRVPLWAAQPFCDRYLDWAAGRSRTLDDAFGVVPLTQRKFATRRRHDGLRLKIVYRVLRLHKQEHKPIGAVTFATVAQELNVSESTVRRIYYDKTSAVLRKILTNATLS